MPDQGHIAGPVVIPNCMQVRMIWTLANSKTVYNVLHGRVAGGFTPTTTIAQAVFAALLAAAGWTNWRPLLNTAVSFAGIDLRDLRQVNQPIIQSTGGAVAGTGVGGALPPGDAACVTLRTAAVGRSNRGRVYLPGLDQAGMAAGGVLAAGTVTNAAAFVTALQTAATASGITLAIANPARAQYTSTVTGAVHPARIAATVDVTTAVTRNNIVDHQRRRAGRS